MPLLFTLSMPRNNSWNGRWSGEDNIYAKTRPVPSQAKQNAVLGYHTHSFGDGWIAAVEVKKVTAQEAKRIMKKSKGFCGYDWMISSIMTHGEIRA